jgi:geranylgeranyl diphosphate synthase type I
MTATELPRALTRYRREIADEIRGLLGERELSLYGMMRYHMGWTEPGVSNGEPSGKFLRASLCLAAGTALGGDFRTALPVAAGVELLHNFSLIHDDIQDGSDNRRNRESVWRIWGEAQAINAGDGMFAMARLAIHRARDRGVPPETVLRMMRLVDQASLELSEGQFQDIAFEARESVSRQEYLEMAERKTGAVMGAAAAAGALSADAPANVVTAFEAFGRKLGVAFQIRDDVLGVWGDPAQTGKSIEDDLRARKKSYPVVFALTEAGALSGDLLRSILAQPEIAPSEVREVVSILDTAGAREAAQGAAATLIAEALDELKSLNLAGAPTEDLSGIAAFVVERES